MEPLAPLSLRRRGARHFLFGGVCGRLGWAPGWAPGTSCALPFRVWPSAASAVVPEAPSGTAGDSRRGGPTHLVAHVLLAVGHDGRVASFTMVPPIERRRCGPRHLVEARPRRPVRRLWRHRRRDRLPNSALDGDRSTGSRTAPRIDGRHSPLQVDSRREQSSARSSRLAGGHSSAGIPAALPHSSGSERR